METLIDDASVARAVSRLQEYYGRLFEKVEKLAVARAENSRADFTGGTLKIFYAHKRDIFPLLCRAVLYGGHAEVFKRIPHTGALIDCARNAVPNMDFLRRFIALLALMGFDRLQLYVEDCMQVMDEPYFGYMRGRFTYETLREIDAYCADFGIELVPCVQTLAHLQRLFMHWHVYTDRIRDKDDVLLVGEDRTYELIENVIKTCAACFTSRRINIGMDEGIELGNGEYLKRFGREDRGKILRKHLARMLEICGKYGFSPSMWADSFYGDILRGDIEDIPDGVELIYWTYSIPNRNGFLAMLDALDRSGKKFSFAGGCHKWYGHAPLNAFTESVFDAQFDAVAASGAREFLVTMWGDNGAECSTASVLPSLAYFAQMNFSQADFADKFLKKTVGYSHAEMLALDSPNEISSDSAAQVNPGKYLLYQDAFYGIEELRTVPDFPERYAARTKRLAALSRRDSPYAYLFGTLAALCSFLELKSTLAADNDAAYKNKDRAALAFLAGTRYPETIRRLKKFIAAFDKQWKKENRPFGFEIHRFRLYGCLAQLEYQQKALADYLDGKIDKIEELEEEKLCSVPDDAEVVLYNDFQSSASYNGF